ncbi:glycosyltransferase [Dyella jejuensis]|uniref:Glycosyltransferase n=1 Tax=Dyella jejuensis TaxID=1432009 RepID=A0ABW8JEB2_9GAMM
MKVLILTNLFPTPWDPLRGAFNRQQFERLGQLHEVDVITAVDFRERLGDPRGQVDAGHLHTGHFVFVFPPGIGRSLHALCWLLSLWWQCGSRIRKAGYDCMLVSWAYPDGAAAGWLARRLGIPYVLKVHGNDLNVQANHMLRRPQIRSALTGAAGVVAVSRALAAKAIALGAHPSNVHVLYNGVDTSIFSPEERLRSRARLGFSTYSPMLLFVGNLKASKGCLDLLEAFPALLAAQPLARLVYVGTGAARAALLARAKALGCLDHVEMAGAVVHAELGDWFRAADLVCLPSHNEGVPNVVLEAMACGTPVVASHVGGIPEVVPEYAGILVPPHQRQALSAALIEASARRWNRTRIATHARGFRWEDNIRHLDAILCAAATGAAVSMGASA